jgi:hypothetical protein
MENDEGNAKMEVLDATKKLNLVEENEPVQLDAVEKWRSFVCVCCFFVFSFFLGVYLRTHNSKVQRTFIECCLDNAMMEVLDATKKLNLVENEPVQSMAVEREQEEVIKKTPTTDEIDLSVVGVLLMTSYCTFSTKFSSSVVGVSLMTSSCSLSIKSISSVVGILLIRGH